MKTAQSLFLVFLSLFAQAAIAGNTAKLWPTIPFIRGADLCQYKQSFSQTRSEYMREMTDLASDLMYSGAKGSEALDMLLAFDALYDKNKRLALQGKYLDVTLENTLKGYVDQYYRNLRPSSRNISFNHLPGARHIINAARNGQRPGYVPADIFDQLDYVAYGSYTLAPNCKGNIVVTVTLVGRYGDTKTYMGTGKPATVMSKIGSTMFEDFQRTKFPSTIKIRNTKLTLLGGINGDIDKVWDLSSAKDMCQTMGGRLPNSSELEIIGNYGSWNGGITLGDKAWALRSGKVYKGTLRNPSPVRNRWEINDREFYYTCVK
ncbi:hypothetical protein OAT67_05315 [Bacteriovoracaceae bacterium]|nr:hypothetical protein [Bacteriovoracaceae bacterium]